MINIFLENIWRKCGGGTSLIPFFKKLKIEHVSTCFILFVFFVCPSRGDYQKILKLRYWQPAFNSYEDLLKIKKGFGTSPPAFLHDF